MLYSETRHRLLLYPSICTKSPDSVVQMSILLAYFSLYGKIVCAYEPVLTKRFTHGRTEAMRSTTSKVTELCNIWTNPVSSDDQKMEALREATLYHSKLVKEASEGKGFDRHLYALQCIAEKNNLPVPKFFQSKAWKTLNHTVMSTSNCGNPAIRLFGFGPATTDGFGIGYIIKDNGIQYSISSRHRQTRRYAKTLQETLIEIGKMLEPLTYCAMGYHGDSLLKETVEPEIASIYQSLSEREESMNKSDKHSSYEHTKRSEQFSDYVSRTPSFVGRALRRQSSLKTVTLNMVGTEINKTLKVAWKAAV